MRSPSQQVDESQQRASELLVEPDAEVVQRNVGRQTSPQPAQLMGSLAVKTKSVMKLVVNRLYNLVDGCCPTPEPLGPSPFALVSSRWVEEADSVALKPALWFSSASKPLSVTYGLVVAIEL